MKYPRPEQLTEVRTRWFNEHRATLTAHADHLHELRWRKPGSGIYGITYLLCGGALLVHGDLGEAVYRWGGSDDRLTFAWIANCGLDYFHGKCCASERGRDYVRFDYRAFKANIEEEIASGELRVRGDAWKYRIDEVSEESEAREFLEKHFNNCDSETLGSLMNSGRVLELRCASHHIGIQMAVEQLAVPAPAQPA